jgi:predicted RNA binding protein YcfA (HicA-like mRNA interferase family)
LKLPRDLSADQLARALERSLGYKLTRQTGSHRRLTTLRHGEHHVTIPAHGLLRVGTLGAILRAIAAHHEISREELLAMLFSDLS